jgi:hypothetical protein
MIVVASLSEAPPASSAGPVSGTTPARPVRS